MIKKTLVKSTIKTEIKIMEKEILQLMMIIIIPARSSIMMIMIILNKRIVQLLWQTLEAKNREKEKEKEKKK